MVIILRRIYKFTLQTYILKSKVNNIGSRFYLISPFRAKEKCIDIKKEKNTQRKKLVTFIIEHFNSWNGYVEFT